MYIPISLRRYICLLFSDLLLLPVSLPPLQEAVTAPFPPIPLGQKRQVRHPERAGQDMGARGIEERHALDNGPVVLVGHIVRLVGRERLGGALGVLGVDEEGAGVDVDVLGGVLLVAVVHAAGGQPGAAPEAETGAGLGEVARQEAAELGADEFGVHVVGEEVRGREAVPFLAEADKVAVVRAQAAFGGGGGERGVDLEGRRVGGHEAVDAGEGDEGAEDEAGKDGGGPEPGGDLADEGGAADVAEGGEEDVRGDGGVEGQERVGRVHEALLLVGLEGEDGQPKVEGGDEDEEAQARADVVGGGGGDLSEEEEGEAEQGEDEPDVEVEEQVTEVERPGLGPVEVGTAGVSEDVVLDNVPGDDLELPVEESVDARVDKLGTQLVSARKKTNREITPKII